MSQYDKMNKTFQACCLKKLSDLGSGNNNIEIIFDEMSLHIAILIT
jgi:hypothetical protein